MFMVGEFMVGEFDFVSETGLKAQVRKKATAILKRTGRTGIPVQSMATTASISTSSSGSTS